MTNENRTRITALIAIVAIAPAVLAQGGQRGQGGPPQGGQGGPGMRQGGPGMQGHAILFRQDVQKELKLTEDQIGKLRDVVPVPGGPGVPPPIQRGQGDQRQQGGPPQGQRGPGRRSPEEMQKLDAAIKGVLNDSQYKRYHELDLQLAGAMAVLRADVSEKLKLSEEQIGKVREVARPQGERGQGQRQDGPPQGFDPTQMDKMRKEQDEKILALLTNAQLVQWHKMLGKKFEFEKMGPPAGGPGQFGHRGGGN